MKLYTLLACLSVCLYPINVKTTEPIGPTSINDSIFKNLLPTKFRFALNFENPGIFFCKTPLILFGFVLQFLQRENVHNKNTRRARSALKA